MGRLDGGAITSDAGGLRLGEVEKRPGIVDRVRDMKVVRAKGSDGLIIRSPDRRTE